MFLNKNGCVECGKKAKYEWGKQRYCFEHFNKVKSSCKESVTVTVPQEIDLIVNNTPNENNKVDFQIELPIRKRRCRKSKTLDV